MPRARRSNLSRQSRNARRIRNTANERTEEEQEIAREQRRDSMARLRASQSREQSEAARETARLAMRNRRANNRGQQIDNLRRRTRYLSSADLNRAAFRYDCSNDYSLHPSVCIGQMDVVCEYCGALKFSGEKAGLCCLNGKVKLPLLTPPHEPLYSLLCGETQESRHFLANTQKYNGCFQMTSFGADIIEERGFNPTFKDDENNLVTVANSSIQEEPWKIPVKIEINEEQSKECYPASPNNEDFNQSREEIYYGNLHSNTKGKKNLSLAEVMVEPPHQQQLIKTNTKQSVPVEISTYDEVPFPVEVKLEPLDDPVHSEPEWIIPDDNFSQEVNVDKNNEMYCCYTCQKLFPSLEELNHHFSEYHLCNSITVEYNCQSCDFSTPVLTDLQKHSELHKIKPFKCSHCDKTFEFQRYLIQHEVVHSAEKWFECEICNRKFRRHCDYKMHIPTHTEDPFPCNVCGKQFKLYRSLLQHEIVHKEPEKKHVCIVCGKRFRRQCDYFTHAKTHTNEPFKCKHCDKSFSLKRNLLQHEVVHTQEKSIECDICGKKFRRHCDYKVHAFFHSGIKSHTCSVCGKSFTLKRSLMLHSATHSVLRRVLKCLKCNKTFNTHWRLYKHGPCYENSFDELNEQDQSELCNLNKYSRNININKKGLHETVSRIQECMATEQDQSELPVPELNLTDCCNVRFSENTTDEKISQLQESVTSEEHSELIPIVCNTNFENN